MAAEELLALAGVTVILLYGLAQLVPRSHWVDVSDLVVNCVGADASQSAIFSHDKGFCDLELPEDAIDRRSPVIGMLAGTHAVRIAQMRFVRSDDTYTSYSGAPDGVVYTVRVDRTAARMIKIEFLGMRLR